MQFKVSITNKIFDLGWDLWYFLFSMVFVGSGFISFDKDTGPNPDPALLWIWIRIESAAVFQAAS